MTYDPSKWFSYSKLYDQSQGDTSASYVPNYSTNEAEQASDSATFHEPSKQKDSSSNIYLASTVFMPQGSNDEYDPCAPSIIKQVENQNYEKPDPRKLEHYITMLQRMIRPLSLEYKKKLPYDMICQLAHSILDGTVFEIAHGLKDIQSITEKNLSEKRNAVVNEQKQKRVEMTKRHQNEIENSQSRPHQILVLEKKHMEEEKIFKEKCEKELTPIDQKVILELDQLMSDQQATFQRAGLPFFYITNDPEDIRLQISTSKLVFPTTSDNLNLQGTGGNSSN